MDINKFGENVNQAAQRLAETLVPELSYPYEEYFNSDHFAQTISSSPPYALRIIAQSTNALADFEPEPGKERRQTRKDIQTALNYAHSYYRNYASIGQAARMLLYVDGTLQNAVIPELPSSMHDFLLEVANGGGNPQRGENISALMERYHEAAAAAQLIASRNLEELSKIAGIHHETTSSSSITEAYLADPSQYLLAEYVDTRNIAGFRLARQRLADNGTLAADEELNAAFNTLNRFIDDIITPNVSLYRNQTFDERISDEQRNIEEVEAAEALETLNIAGCQGLRAAVVKSIKESSMAGNVTHRQLVDYLIALSDYQTEDPQTQNQLKTVNTWIVRSFIHGDKYSIGFGVVDIEDRLQEGSLSPNAEESLKQLIHDLGAHSIYINSQHETGRSIPEPRRTVIYCRACKALESLQTVVGLQGLDRMMGEMERAQNEAPPAMHNDFERWYLEPPQGREALWRAGHYKAVLQHIVDTTDPQAEAARRVIDYINTYFGQSASPAENTVAYLDYYFEAADLKTQLQGTARALMPLWHEVIARGVQEEFMLAQEDPNAAAQLMKQGDGEIWDYLYTLYEIRNIREPGILAQISAALVMDEEPTPPHTIANIIARENNPDINCIPDIIARIEEDPKTVLWDTAKWLHDANRQLPYARNLTKPRLKSIKEYTGRMFALYQGGNVFGLEKEMEEALGAMREFDMNNRLLETLCADFPRTKVMGAGDSNSSDPICPNYAWLVLRLEQEIEDGGPKAEAAQKALPFLQKAIVHGDIDPVVDEEKETLHHLMQTAASIGDTGNPEISDRAKLLQHLSSGYDAAYLMAIVNDHLAEAKDGTTSLDAGQVDRLRVFKQELAAMVSDHDYQQEFDKNKLLADARVAFQHIRAAEENIPELRNIQTRDGESAPLKNFFDMTHGSFDTTVPHIQEQFFIAIEDALASGREMPPGMQRSLEAMRDYMQAEFDKNDAFFEEHNYETSHAATIEAIRAQQRGPDDGRPSAGR
ncbi:MAG TPA: hypothetical protein VFT64_06830 [Rickettsiales bacterium]|nr:hypothetical protein [Rickettsiales bacterium]